VTGVQTCALPICLLYCVNLRRMGLVYMSYSATLSQGGEYRDTKFVYIHITPFAVKFVLACTAPGALTANQRVRDAT
jgi:hypothetical protein